MLVALLTASAFVAQAVVDNRANRQSLAARWLYAGIAGGMVYVVVKCWEQL